MQRHPLRCGGTRDLPDLHGKKRVCPDRQKRSKVCNGAMNKEELRRVLEKFTENNDFILNPDERHVDAIIEGVPENERKKGLKLCPCRIGGGTMQSDLELLCPCNFKVHDTWRDEGRCWCGLFIKKPSMKSFCLFYG